MSSSSNKRVLRMVIIDSDRRSRIHLRELLNRINVRVIGEAEDLKSGIRLIHGLQPDAVLLEIPHDTSGAMEMIKTIHNEQPDTSIILSSHESTPQLILSCIRAGAREFITRPIDSAELHKAVEHIQSVSQKRMISKNKKRGSIISVFACKGGVGTTSVATNLGVALSQRNESKTVLVDLNFHMGDLGLMLDQPPKRCLVNALEGSALNESKLQSVIMQYKAGIHILTCVTSPEMSDEITCDHIAEVIGTLCTMYDNVIVDVGRHLDDRTVEVLELSDMILLIASQDITTVRNVSRYLDIFERLEIDPDMIQLIVNRYHKRSRVSLKDLEVVLEIETFWNIPNDFESMSHAIDAGIPAVIYAPRSKVAQSYMDLAEYITEFQEKQTESEPVMMTPD